jgi:hypothetical protein
MLEISCTLSLGLSHKCRHRNRLFPSFLATVPRPASLLPTRQQQARGHGPQTREETRDIARLQKGRAPSYHISWILYPIPSHTHRSFILPLPCAFFPLLSRSLLVFQVTRPSVRSRSRDFTQPARKKKNTTNVSVCAYVSPICCVSCTHFIHMYM